MSDEAVAPTVRELLRKVLTENGIDHNYEMHSWRCGYPDVYGPCTCVAELLDDLTAALSAHDASVAEQAERRGFNRGYALANREWQLAGDGRGMA